MQLWMAVQLLVRMGSFLNVTTVAAVDLTEFTLTAVGKYKSKNARMKTKGGAAFGMLKVWLPEELPQAGCDINFRKFN